MKWLVRLVLLVVILLPVSVVAAAYLAIDDFPLITQDVRLTPSEVQRAKHLFEEHDPRKLKDGDIKTLAVTQHDLSLASNYLLHLLGRGGSVVTLKQGYLATQATIQLPTNPLGRYLNVDVGVTQSTPLPHITHLRFGHLVIPGWIADKGFQMGLNKMYNQPGSRLASDLIHDVVIGDTRLKVTYQWDSSITEVVRTALVPEKEQARLQAYYQRLHKVTSSIGSTRTNVSLVRLMQPLFALAQERSRASDVVSENRAVVVMLSSYIHGRGLTRMVPEAEHWPKLVKHRVTLQGRKDFSQHFITSAALAMAGGNPLSNAIGLFKEVDDSRGGSGFSFTDLGADKAGTLFGEQVTSPTSASKLQHRLAASLREDDVMPEVKDLPEGLSESEFLQRFGGLDSPRYHKMVAQINQRVNALPLYQSL